MQSRKKWKRRYYKERKRKKEADKSVEQIYRDYQDAGKKMFEYAEQVQQLETNNKNLIEKLEEYKYIKIPGIKEIIEEILKIAKGERE